MSSIGNTCEYPPPAAPPFIPKQGPREGSRRATMAFLPMWFKPWANATEVVVFPLPLLLGVVAVTKISLPWLICAWLGTKSTLALYFPYCSKISGSTLLSVAIASMRFSFACWAISMSVSIVFRAVNI